MKVLGIDTSCDDTSMAIIKVKGKKNQKFQILANIVSSQVKIHRKYGGVLPSLAKREHQKNLPIVLEKAFKKAKLSLKKPEIDLIAVTVGPGLEICLWQGVNFAKKLSENWKKPIIPVNHIESHILSNFFGQVSGLSPIFPAIALVVSGGHTQLILMKKIGKYKILGETRDDAAGECFDKTARILGLSYPGGPAIAKVAKLSKGLLAGKLPRPMIYSRDYDFSFSGLKTAVLYDYKKRPKKIRKSKKYIQEISAEIQQAIIDVLIKKTIKAAKDFQARSIILGGGVAANEELRRQFKLTLKSNLNLKFFVPEKNLCTDNAAMVALTGYFYWLKEKQKGWKKIRAKANLKIN